MTNPFVLAIGINTTKEEKLKIQEKLKQKKITLDIASIKDILLEIEDNIPKITIKDKDLVKYDYIWIQSGWNTTHMAYLLHLYLKSKNILHNKVGINRTKLSDILSLSLKSIPVPNTFFHNGLKIDEENIQKIEKVCKIPCIYKTSLGSLGSDVYLINKDIDIQKTIKENGKYNRYIFQEYIPNNFDYRVVVANNKPTSVCKRTRIKDKYRNNVALGAKEEFINLWDVPNNILEIATKSAKLLKLNWAGVDIVTNKDTNKDYVLEVNRRPGLTEKSSEVSAAYRYITGLVKNSCS